MACQQVQWSGRGEGYQVIDREDKLEFTRYFCIYSSLYLVEFHFCISTQVPLLTNTNHVCMLTDHPYTAFIAYQCSFKKILDLLAHRFQVVKLSSKELAPVKSTRPRAGWRLMSYVKRLPKCLALVPVTQPQRIICRSWVNHAHWHFQAFAYTGPEAWILFILKENRVYPPNMPLWHIDYFESKLLKKQPMQKEHSDPPGFPWKQEINFPC